MPSLNMCGFLYTGADLGGFGADTAREFLLRHLALGVFIPLMLGNEIMIALNEVPLFIREGKCIPVAEVAESVDQIDLSTLTMLGFDEAEYLLYDDDGVHKDYENEGTCRKIGK